MSTGLFEQTYDTNVFGVVRVVEAFLPLLALGRRANRECLLDDGIAE